MKASIMSMYDTTRESILIQVELGTPYRIAAPFAGVASEPGANALVISSSVHYLHFLVLICEAELT